MIAHTKKIVDIQNKMFFNTFNDITFPFYFYLLLIE